MLAFVVIESIENKRVKRRW